MSNEENNPKIFTFLSLLLKLHLHRPALGVLIIEPSTDLGIIGSVDIFPFLRINIRYKQANRLIASCPLFSKFQSLIQSMI